MDRGHGMEFRAIRFKFQDKANTLGSDNWKGLINRQNKVPPIITVEEQEILSKGHFKAK